MGRAATENFPVTSVLMPRQVRSGLLAVYGFARLVDQLGDSYGGDRAAALDWVDAELTHALERPAGDVEPLVGRAADCVRRTGADPRWLHELIEANRADQHVARYPTFPDLEGYCRLSAQPVGRLVLAVFGMATPARIELADRICTGLQLAEHWQDVAEDHAAGRIYVPQDDLCRFGVSEDQLAKGAAPAPPELRALLAFEAARARRFLEDGQPLVATLHGWARWAVCAFVAGGHAALDALADQGFDPLAATPRPRPHRLAVRFVAAARGGRSA